MYFKSADNRSKINIPIGYRGTAFSSPSPSNNIISSQGSSLQSAPPHNAEKEPPTLPLKDIGENGNISDTTALMPEKKAVTPPLFFSEGGLGAEELLILALALIIFQGGKENELALLLLALLFIK